VSGSARPVEAGLSTPLGLVSRTRPLSVDGELLDALAVRLGGLGGFAWLHDGGGLMASGVAARVRLGTGVSTIGVGESAGGSPIETAAAEVEDLLAEIEIDDPLRLPGTGPIAVGALPFGRPDGSPRVDGQGDLVVPATVVGRSSDGRGWITTTEAVDAQEEVGHRNHESSRLAKESQRRRGLGAPSRFVVGGGAGRQRFTAAVREALDTIDGTPLAKVVLARQVTVEADQAFDLTDVLRRLQRLDPGCFVYAAAGIVGASPELLVRRRGDRAVSRPMAGSTARGATVAEDRWLADRLEASDKELDEHRMVVEAVRAALEGVCHQVVAEARPEVVRLATVAHLATSVVGVLRAPEPSALALAGILHPTPAVAGAPRPLALDTISRLEDFDRGLYGGPVGWVDSRGDGDWAVALRCAQIDESGKLARLTAGAGVVAGSDPDAEWAETQAKLEPMLRALVQP